MNGPGPIQLSGELSGCMKDERRRGLPTSQGENLYMPGRQPLFARNACGSESSRISRGAATGKPLRQLVASEMRGDRPTYLKFVREQR
jgi:hypothetical protein